MKTKRQLLAVAAGSGLLAAVPPALAQTWRLTSAPSTNWTSVACSADGSKLVAVASTGPIGYPLVPGPICISTDSGATWKTTSALITNWVAVASSADGTKLVAAANGLIYSSTNSGLTWTQTTAPNEWWSAVACSADGTKLAAVTDEYGVGPMQGAIYTSTDSATTWQVLAQLGPLSSIASSADGATLIAVGWYPRPGGFMPTTYLTTNWGATSVEIPFEPLGSWTCAASSAEGSTLVVGASGATSGNPIFVSTDSGTTWRQTSAPNKYWTAITSSADGIKFLAAGPTNIWSGDPGGIYSSIDAGATWISNSAPSLPWSSVASSADGCKLVAVANGGGIYTWQTTPTPVLNVTPSGTNLLLSWIIPSQPFVLQENADLATSNWTDVASAPVLNLTNLQHQVTLPLANARRFYRLKRS